ncbi:calcium-binding protein [Acuticoccus kandeliae]|uniref:calcium-binding protein n=1 Tax=Acuticoccus kandeliae TaxID=2073160 RepID=UPI000D3E1394|nr:calcium-binding protein [Acuticoccus kandeliae]
MLELGDLGTQVFLYVPANGEEPAHFVELTEEIGPGFGDPKNKYTWSATLFDPDGEEGPEGPDLYVGTLNGQTSYVGGIGASVVFNAVANTGGDSVFSLLFGGDSEGLREFLGGDFPNTISSDGPEIWKYDFDTGEWSQAYDTGPGSLVDDEDLGFRDGVSFNGSVYFSTSTSLIFSLLEAGNNEAKIVYSSDGENWDELTGGPLDVEGTASIRALTVINDPDGTGKALLVGTENVTEGAQLWYYDEEGNWHQVASFDGTSGLPYAAAVSETLVVGNEIDGYETYIGTWFPYGIFKIDSAGVITEVTPPGPPTGDGVMQLIEFDGYLYVGSVNYFQGGATLYRMDLDNPGTWETITDDGFETELPDDYDGPGVADATYVWQTYVIGDSLFIGDFSGPGKLIELTHETDNKGTPEDPTDDTAWTLKVVTDELDNNLSFGDSAYGVRKLVGVSVEWDEEKQLWVATEDQSTPNALIIGAADPYNAMTESLLELIINRNGDTVSGTPFQADELNGTELEDLILGGLRGDLINGGDEDDFIVGDFWGLGIGGGRDTVNGGEGTDVVFGNSGNDIINGDEGEDFLIGGAGRDRMFGGDGIDIMLGDFVTDGTVGDVISPLLEGLLGGLLGGEEEPDPNAPDIAAILAEITGATADLLESIGQLNDTMFGQDGNDIMIGGRGLDRMFGGAGNDIMYGNEGNDRVVGGAGNDIIFGDEGNDFMIGGRGNDTFVTGLGDDVMFGGLGNDRFVVKGDNESDVIDTGNDIIRNFVQGQDVIDLSLFVDLTPNGQGQEAFDYLTDLHDVAFSASAEGWLVIDLSLIDSNIDDVTGAGTIVVEGLLFEDVLESDFKFDSQISNASLNGGFFF